MGARQQGQLVSSGVIVTSTRGTYHDGQSIGAG
jgi:ribosomal protein L27